MLHTLCHEHLTVTVATNGAQRVCHANVIHAVTLGKLGSVSLLGLDIREDPALLLMNLTLTVRDVSTCTLPLVSVSTVIASVSLRLPAGRVGSL